MLCRTCEKRDRCSRLCGDAEKYVSQDEVPCRDLVVGLKPSYSNRALGDWIPMGRSLFKLSPLQKRIISLILLGYDIKQIEERLDISHNVAWITLMRARKRLGIRKGADIEIYDDNRANQILSLLLRGYTRERIAKELFWSDQELKEVTCSLVMGWVTVFAMYRRKHKNDGREDEA